MNNLVQDITYKNKSPQLDALRQKGLTAFKAVGLPTAKTEAWKFTRLRDLNRDDYEPSRISKPKAISLPFECTVIDICNGFVVSDMPNIDGVTFKNATEAEFIQNANMSQHPFAALNTYYLDRGLFIEIRKKLSRPIVLNYHMQPEDKNYFYHFRTIVVCQPGSQAEIIEQFTYSGDVKSCYLANLVNQIFINEGATLKHYKYQNEAFKANHIALHFVNIEKDGKYESFCLQKGANIARNETEVFLNGEGAEALVNGAYRMNGWATIDTTTNIYHYVPHTKSSQLVKGVVGGEAKGVFQGKIHIAPNAVETSGTQLHKAVLLSDTAEIDVKPELEIFADDVKCSHGAASGELDKDQLFYMQARGIGEEEAKQILIDAYLNDVVSQISDTKISDWFKNLV